MPTGFLSLLVLLLFQYGNVPLKSKGEFSVSVDLAFRKHAVSAAPNLGNTRVEFTDRLTEPEARLTGGQHAFVFFNVTLLQLGNKELRAKLMDATGFVLFNKKVKPGQVVKVELGFIDEMKERKADSDFNLILYDGDKEPASRIHLLIDMEGNYYVNDERRGKF